MPKRKNSPKRTLENVHTEYDEKGDWVQKKNRIKGSLRQAFRMSPQMWETLELARVELPPALKKDGNPGKKNQVRFRCAICGELFMKKFVQVDHILPVVPFTKKEVDMTYDELVDGIFCKKDNLQVVCSTPLKYNNGKPSCHKIKTDEENYIRDRLVEIRKIYENDFYYCKFTEELCCLHIIELKNEYKVYLEKKEEKRIDKEKRKTEREAKRKK